VKEKRKGSHFKGGKGARSRKTKSLKGTKGWSKKIIRAKKAKTQLVREDTD